MSTNVKTIIGFSAYTIHNGKVFNVKTGNEMAMKKGTGKYYLKNDSGEMKLSKVEDLKLGTKLAPMGNASDTPAPKQTAKAKTEVPAEKTPKVKEKATPAPKAVKEKEAQRSKKELMEIPKVKKIVDSEVTRHLKVYNLHEAKLSNKEIAALFGMSAGNVSRDLWGYKTGRYTVPVA